MIPLFMKAQVNKPVELTYSAPASSAWKPLPLTALMTPLNMKAQINLPVQLTYSVPLLSASKPLQLMR
jgi:hypothetical protein